MKELDDLRLDLDNDTFRKLAKKATDMILELFDSYENRKAFPGKLAAELPLLLSETLPERSTELDLLLDTIAKEVFPYASYNTGPYYNAYVTSCSTQAGIIAEFIAATLNQNSAKWNLSVIATEMERLVIDWIAAFLRLPESFGGILVSGGSMANLTGLAVGLHCRFPELTETGLYGHRQLKVYVSEEVHHCIGKSVRMLGLGMNSLVKLPVKDDFSFDTALLKQQIENDIAIGHQPFCVIASAGTVNTGAVDDFEAIAAICQQNKMWFHIDGAYGAPVSALDDFEKMYSGLHLADSIVVDPHKWLFCPYEAGCTLFKDPFNAKKVFSDIPDYLAADKIDDRHDFMEYGIQLSRNFKALKIWATFKAYGAAAIRKAIRHDIDKAAYMNVLVSNSDDFEVTGNGPLSALCFRYVNTYFSHDDLEKINHTLLQTIERDGRIFVAGTKINGKTSMRICFVNHRAQQRHVDYIFSVISELSVKVVGQFSMIS